jgi:hypothetical protein
MNDKDNLPRGYVIRYTMQKEDLDEFLEQLYDMQQEYVEAAVEASKYKDAREIINHIRSL